MTPVGWSTDSWADGSWATGAWGEVEGANYPGWADGAWAAGTWAVGAWGESADLSVTIDTPGGITVAGQSFTFAWSVPWDAGAITIEGQSVFAGFVLDLALDATEAQDTAALSLDVETNERSLALAATEAQDTADLDATVTVSAALDATEAADTFAATLLRQVNLALAATEAADTLAVSALNISAPAPKVSGGAGKPSRKIKLVPAAQWLGSLGPGTETTVLPFEPPQLPPARTVSVAAAEAPDSASAAVATVARIAILAAEAPDNVASFASARVTAMAAISEPADGMGMTLAVSWADVDAEVLQTFARLRSAQAA